MKLRNVAKLFPDLNQYKVIVCTGDRIFSVEDLKQFPSYLDRYIKSIKISSSLFAIKMEIYI